MYGAHRLKLVRLSFLVTGDRHAAEEIVHEAFISAQRAWPRVREGESYLHTSVINASRSWLRRRATEQRHARPVAVVALSAPDELWDVLQRLRPRQRAAIVLRYYEGLPDAAIAVVLGCRVATVRTSIHRALVALRKELPR